MRKGTFTTARLGLSSANSGAIVLKYLAVGEGEKEPSGVPRVVGRSGVEFDQSGVALKCKVRVHRAHHFKI